MKPSMRLVHRFAMPRANPLADTGIRAEYDLSDWCVRECSEPQRSYGGAKADLCQGFGKVLGREVRASPNEFGAGIPLTGLFECGPSNMNSGEIREHASNWLAPPEHGRRGKQRRGNVYRKFRPRYLDYLPNPVSLHRCTKSGSVSERSSRRRLCIARALRISGHKERMVHRSNRWVIFAQASQLA